MLDIKIFRNVPSELYVGIYGNGMVSIYKETMDYFSKYDGITIGMGNDERLYFKFTKNDNESPKIKRSKSGSAYVNTSKMFTMNDIDKKERVGRYRLEPVKGFEYYKGFYALNGYPIPPSRRKTPRNSRKKLKKRWGRTKKICNESWNLKIKSYICIVTTPPPKMVTMT